MIKDRLGNIIKVGDRFKYQVGEKHEVIGKIVRKGRGFFIRWEDRKPDIRLFDFWYAPADEKITEILR